jgi:copper transport protein
VSAFSLVTNLVLFVGLGLGVGSVVARWWIIPSGRTDLDERAARIGSGAAFLLLAAMPLVFARQLVEFRDPFSPWREEAFLLLGTAWGRTWLYGALGSLAVVVACRAHVAGRRGAGAVSSVLILAMGVFPAVTGHANAGDLRRFTLAADVLHVWAMGGWVGGLATILLLEWAHRHGPIPSGSLLRELIPHFSPVAMTSVGVLSLTGLFASWVHVDGVGALFGTTYGRLLLLKLALVGGVLGLGAINFRRLTPRLDTPEGPGAMRRSAGVELGIAGLVLVVTAVLVRTSP